MSASSDDHSGQLSASTAAAVGPNRPGRSDAARNRRALLRAARSAFAGGDDVAAVSLHAIAQAAGVGQGTLYRHFPTRDDLLVAVYETEIATLVDSVDELLASATPREALRRWLIGLAGYGSVKRSLGPIIRAATSATLTDSWRVRVLDAIDRLLVAGRRAGELRDDVDALEVLSLCTFLWVRDPIPDEDVDPARLLDIVVDGLSSGANVRR